MTEEKTWWEKYNLLVSTLVIVFTILAVWWSVLGAINDNRKAIVENREKIIQNGAGIIQNGEKILQNGEKILQNGKKIDSFNDSHRREHDLFYGLPANVEATTKTESETP